MKINEITEIQMKIIINGNLYKRKLIDENTFSKVNEELLKILKGLQMA